MRSEYLLFVIWASVLICCHGSAERIEIGQGDIIYQNETVDISLAGSWPDYQVAWCAANNDVCDPPDIVVQLQGNLHQYWMGSGNFSKFGTCYRWDGEWHRGENAVAFRYLPGTRPVYLNQTNITTGNTTDLKPVILGPWQYLVARGDSPSWSINANRTDPCHLWVFGDNPDLLDVRLANDNYTYMVNLTSGNTLGLKPGTYPSYLQFNGNNSIQDIYFADMTLDTPYDDTFVPDVPVTYWNLSKAKEQYDTLAQTMPYYDDVIIPVSVVVEDPGMSVTNVEQDQDKLWISGVTNWDSGTEITLVLDPGQYPLPKDRRAHTWLSWARGGIDERRTFSTALKISAGDIAVGPHDIEMTVNDTGNLTISTYNFWRSDVYVMPTPTPERRPVLLTADMQVIPTVPTPLPTTPGPNVTLVQFDRDSQYGYDRVPITVTPAPTWTPTGNVGVSLASGLEPTLNITATMTPHAVNRTGNATVTPDGNIHVPVPVWVPVLALALVAVWRRR